MGRPPRVLVASTLTEGQWEQLPAWQGALGRQDSPLLWDVALVDGTDRPSAGYVERLREWTKGMPFGPTHRVRLLRVGLDAEGTMFVAAGYKLAHARRLLWDKFSSWRSYEYLWLLDVPLAPPPACLRRLHESGQPWAVALLNGTVQPMRNSLLQGDVVRQVPFEIALDGDMEYSRACTQRGIYPALVPIAR